MTDFVESSRAMAQEQLSHPDGRPMSMPQSQSQDTTNTPSIKQSRSGRSRSRGRRSNSSEPRVVVSSFALYSPSTWLLLAIPLLLIIIQIAGILIVSAKKIEFQRSQEAWVLGWSLVLVLAIYMMVLPRQVDVRSNGSIGIKTFLITYHFTDVLRAYPAAVGPEDFLQPRWKFATTWDPRNRIVIRRRVGKWDVVVSPTEPEQFLEALDKVLAELELQRDIDLASRRHKSRENQDLSQV